MDIVRLLSEPNTILISLLVQHKHATGPMDQTLLTTDSIFSSHPNFHKIFLRNNPFRNPCMNSQKYARRVSTENPSRVPFEHYPGSFSTITPRCSSIFLSESSSSPILNFFQITLTYSQDSYGNCFSRSSGDSSRNFSM